MDKDEKVKARDVLKKKDKPNPRYQETRRYECEIFFDDIPQKVLDSIDENRQSKYE